MDRNLQVIVDENSAAFSFSWTGWNTSSPGPWDVGRWPQWYGGTITFPKSSDAQIGTFTFTFNGTSATFVGNTPASTSPQTAIVQIDNGTSFVINYQDPTPQNYMRWFTTPTLPDGNHTITMSNLYMIAIDYAVVNVGNDTSLAGQTVIVDDDSSLIQYSGQWSRSTNKFTPGNLAPGYPYRNITHRSSNPGDTFTFQFSGTSIAVYGLFSWYNLGSLTTTYSIDGTTYSSPISVTASSPSYSRRDGEVSNYPYFSMESLPSGTHTLLVNITEATNQVFILDYITYKPSFATLSSMPSLSLNVSSGATGSSASHKPSATTSVSSIASNSGSMSTGAIVGGVLGGLIFGALVTILVILLVLRRRRAREQKPAHQDATLGGVNDPNDPHTPNPFEMQEHSSALQSQPANGPAKHERSNSASGRHGIHVSTTPVHPSITGNSGVEEALANPPSYDTISTSVSRRP